MKARQLIKILEAVDSESDVCLSIGAPDNEEYRNLCAKAQLQTEDCLKYLAIDHVIINMDGDSEIWADIILEQDDIYDLEKAAADYDRKIGEKKRLMYGKGEGLT